MKKLVTTLAIVGFVALSAVQTLATPTPVWTMDDNADNAIVLDGSVYANHGTAQQNTSVLHTTGIVDGALTFNGTSDYINSGDSSVFDIIDEISIAAWIKTTDGVNDYIMTKGDDRFYLSVGPTGTTANKISFYLGGVSSSWLQAETFFIPVDFENGLSQ
jgi:hypothetical protein